MQLESSGKNIAGAFKESESGSEKENFVCTVATDKRLWPPKKKKPHSKGKEENAAPWVAHGQGRGETLSV